VFSYAEDATEFLRPDSVSRRFGRLLKRVGLDGVRLHDLRHAVVTDGLTIAAVRTVQRHVGHSSIAMTQKYGHQVSEEDRRLADGLGERLRTALRTG
jgi:integrase